MLPHLWLIQFSALLSPNFCPQVCLNYTNPPSLLSRETMPLTGVNNYHSNSCYYTITYFLITPAGQHQSRRDHSIIFNLASPIPNLNFFSKIFQTSQIFNFSSSTILMIFLILDFWFFDCKPKWPQGSFAQCWTFSN